MKISSFANVLPFTSSMRTKRNDSDGGAAQQQYDPNQSRRDDSDKEKPKSSDPSLAEAAATLRLLSEAVEAFGSDAATQASGLIATVEGVGPGLRVAVKDINGTTLRQFSGDEFLRLREGHSPKDVRSRGKILDQKV